MIGTPPTGSDRVLAILKRLAAYPRGATLEELARDLDAPKSSTHRALASLRRAGLAEQVRQGRYRLGLEFVRLAFAYHEALDERSLVRPTLEALATRFGETAHYGRLDGTEVVYVDKVTPLTGGPQMTSVVGGRNPAHCTGLGKALLAYELPDRAAVDSFVERHGPLLQRTHQTLVTSSALHQELVEIRERGYATDRQESETGINCLAIPLFLGSGVRPSGAISISALAHRTTLAALELAVDEIRNMLEERLGSTTPSETTKIHR